MKTIYGKIKKLSLALGTASLAATLFVQSAKADSIDQPYLQNIQTYTQNIQNTSNSILTTVNNIFAALVELSTLAATMLATDNGSSQPIDWSTQWTNEQTWLSTLGNDAMTNETNQYGMQQNLVTTFFGPTNINVSPPTLPNPVNVNDLSYTTLLGQLLVTPDPRTGVNPAMNYLVNASGLGMPITIPGAGMRGDAVSRKNYTNYYNTVTAVQTYNAFILSRLYEDAQTLQNDNSLRGQLIAQSSNSAWFSSVIANDLGWVLRQILLYNSQMYVLMDQLVQTQKQMLTTLAMNNTLAMVNAQMQGFNLLKQAQGS